MRQKELAGFFDFDPFLIQGDKDRRLAENRGVGKLVSQMIITIGHSFPLGKPPNSLTFIFLLA